MRQVTREYVLMEMDEMLRKVGGDPWNICTWRFKVYGTLIHFPRTG